jgi:hypothetical protein
MSLELSQFGFDGLLTKVCVGAALLRSSPPEAARPSGALRDSLAALAMVFTSTEPWAGKAKE